MRLLILCALLQAIAQDGPKEAADKNPVETPASTHLDVRIHPLVELNAWVRSLAAGGSETADLEGLAAAIAAAKALQVKLQSPLMFGLVEPLLEDCEDAGELERKLGDLPEESPSLPRNLRIRDEAIALAGALADVEESFNEDLWPERKKALEERIHEYRDQLAPRERECFKTLTSDLGMKDPGVRIPLYLVTTYPFPGAITFRREGGGGICFVATGPHPGSQLFETMLHESLHALDVSTQGQDHAFQRLRRLLEDKGLSPRDRRYRDVPHHLMFVEAAEVVRRRVCADHVHYGDLTDYYQKTSPDSRIVREHWLKFLDGELEREDALSGMILQILTPQATDPGK